ncbi:predicted protein [Uncinocarpus reesii 1704]|uniref:Uncharacterized protein n=1 Tax=Uncinocarpus reesii (strain UAMH 1704) TaxID=336963 RepID=C4JSJ6_UNCRE|nr:uncharacterized protein UREG_05435 [Uncinocarpus reesii 1704]EEP80593.1 predicted protein [Uncinocarpus reesii 1704]
MSLLDKLHAKLELYRLEQRYARRKNRNTFTTGATYVDGEYVYSNSTGSSSPSSSSSIPTVSKHGTGSRWKSSSKFRWR